MTSINSELNSHYQFQRNWDFGILGTEKPRDKIEERENKQEDYKQPI